jgi:transglutaminase-like putative cysteine protease
MGRWLLCGMLLAFFSQRIYGIDGSLLQADSDYQAERRNPVTYDVDFSVVVTAPYKTRLLKVWLPIPPSDFGQQVAESTITSFPNPVTPKVAAENVYGNNFAYFEFAEPQGAQVIRHRFRITVWELRWNLEPKKIEKVVDWPGEFDKYRRGESQAIVVDDRFRSLLQEVVPKRDNPLSDLGKVMTWVNDHFEYDHIDASKRASALHGLEKRHGHCSDYHGFCAAMGRALGYPTRVTYGINTFPKNSPSHCKLEAYLPPYGWVSFDVSETQRLVSKINQDEAIDSGHKKDLVRTANERLLKGFRDNTWYAQTRGTDYDLAPPATKRVPVVRTIYAEADGVPLPDPDPANVEEREFAWMTVHKYTPDRPVKYAFDDIESLKE